MTPEMWAMFGAAIAVAIVVVGLIAGSSKKAAVSAIQGRLSGLLDAEKKRSEDLSTRLKDSEKLNTSLMVKEADLMSTEAGLRAKLEA